RRLIRIITPRPRLLGSTPEDRCRNRARGNRVDPDAVRSELNSRETRHMADGGFRSGIEISALAGSMGGDARVVDDAPALLRLHHARRVFDAEHDAAKQKSQSAGERFFRDVVERTAIERSGIVEQAVEPAEAR